MQGLDGATARTGKDVLVKVCGVTRPEDALAAVRASANLIGTIYCTSKRQVNAAQVRTEYRPKASMVG
jgi:phosphoribosylanthranilate isomerase